MKSMEEDVVAKRTLLGANVTDVLQELTVLDPTDAKLAIVIALDQKITTVT